MFVFQKIAFTDLCLNGQLVTLISEGVNRCELYQRQGRHFCAFKITDGVIINNLEVDVQKSLSEFKYSKWVQDTDVAPILDFFLTLRSIPPWMSIYSPVPKGYVHKIQATLKVKDSQSSYVDFTGGLQSIVPRTLWCSMEKDEALSLWNERRAPLSKSIVKCINFKSSLFPSFYPMDMERLKNDNQWLSDTQVTFCLRDCFQKCSQRNIWGNRTVKLLDTTFWEKLTHDPDRYRDGFKNKNNLLECDLAVVPMFRINHWRLGIVEKPDEFLQGNTVLHILDSLPDNSVAMKEEKLLQTILLKHFEGASFMEGRIATNIAEVPLQSNSKDCACFAIYFGTRLFLNLDSTMTLVKAKFPSTADRLVAWGLKNSNLTFVRREITALLLEYLHCGDAVVEFES